MARTLTKIREAMLWLLSMTLLLVAVRFTAVAAGPFLADVSDDAVDSPPLTQPDMPKTSAALEAPAARGKLKPAPTGPVISVLLLAKHSVEHSKVFVNDAFVGHTVLMQNFSCRRGETLTLKLVPDRGPPIEQEKLCAGETISISDEH